MSKSTIMSGAAASGYASHQRMPSKKAAGKDPVQQALEDEIIWRRANEGMRGAVVGNRQPFDPSHPFNPPIGFLKFEKKEYKEYINTFDEGIFERVKREATLNVELTDISDLFSKFYREALFKNITDNTKREEESASKELDFLLKVCYEKIEKDNISPFTFGGRDQNVSSRNVPQNYKEEFKKCKPNIKILIAKIFNQIIQGDEFGLLTPQMIKYLIGARLHYFKICVKEALKSAFWIDREAVLVNGDRAKFNRLEECFKAFYLGESGKEIKVSLDKETLEITKQKAFRERAKVINARALEEFEGNINHIFDVMKKQKRNKDAMPPPMLDPAVAPFEPKSSKLKAKFAAARQDPIKREDIVSEVQKAFLIELDEALHKEEKRAHQIAILKLLVNLDRGLPQNSTTISVFEGQYGKIPDYIAIKLLSKKDADFPGGHRALLDKKLDFLRKESVILKAKIPPEVKIIAGTGEGKTRLSEILEELYKGEDARQYVKIDLNHIPELELFFEVGGRLKRDLTGLVISCDEAYFFSEYFTDDNFFNKILSAERIRVLAAESKDDPEMLGMLKSEAVLREFRKRGALVVSWGASASQYVLKMKGRFHEYKKALEFYKHGQEERLQGGAESASVEDDDGLDTSRASTYGSFSFRTPARKSPEPKKTSEHDRKLRLQSDFLQRQQYLQQKAENARGSLLALQERGGAAVNLITDASVDFLERSVADGDLVQSIKDDAANKWQKLLAGHEQNNKDKRPVALVHGTPIKFSHLKLQYIVPDRDLSAKGRDYFGALMAPDAQSFDVVILPADDVAKREGRKFRAFVRMSNGSVQSEAEIFSNNGRFFNDASKKTIDGLMEFLEQEAQLGTNLAILNIYDSHDAIGGDRESTARQRVAGRIIRINASAQESRDRITTNRILQYEGRDRDRGDDKEDASIDFVIEGLSGARNANKVAGVATLKRLIEKNDKRRDLKVLKAHAFVKKISPERAGEGRHGTDFVNPGNKSIYSAREMRSDGPFEDGAYAAANEQLFDAYLKKVKGLSKYLIENAGEDVQATGGFDEGGGDYSDLQNYGGESDVVFPLVHEYTVQPLGDHVLADDDQASSGLEGGSEEDLLGPRKRSRLRPVGARNSRVPRAGTGHRDDAANDALREEVALLRRVAEKLGSQFTDFLRGLGNRDARGDAEDGRTPKDNEVILRLIEQLQNQQDASAQRLAEQGGMLACELDQQRGVLMESNGRALTQADKRADKEGQLSADVIRELRDQNARLDERHDAAQGRLNKYMEDSARERAEELNGLFAAHVAALQQVQAQTVTALRDVSAQGNEVLRTLATAQAEQSASIVRVLADLAARPVAAAPVAGAAAAAPVPVPVVAHVPAPVHAPAAPVLVADPAAAVRQQDLERQLEAARAEARMVGERALEQAQQNAARERLRHALDSERREEEARQRDGLLRTTYELGLRTVELERVAALERQKGEVTLALEREGRRADLAATQQARQTDAGMHRVGLENERLRGREETLRFELERLRAQLAQAMQPPVTIPAPNVHVHNNLAAPAAVPNYCPVQPLSAAASPAAAGLVSNAVAPKDVAASKKEVPIVTTTDTGTGTGEEDFEELTLLDNDDLVLPEEVYRDYVPQPAKDYEEACRKAIVPLGRGARYMLVSAGPEAFGIGESSEQNKIEAIRKYFDQAMLKLKRVIPQGASQERAVAAMMECISLPASRANDNTLNFLEKSHFLAVIFEMIPQRDPQRKLYEQERTGPTQLLRNTTLTAVDGLPAPDKSEMVAKMFASAFKRFGQQEFRWEIEPASALGSAGRSAAQFGASRSGRGGGNE